jgi:hypothetical protein
MSSGTCEFRPVDYKAVKPGRNKSVLALSTSRNTCRRDGENGDTRVTRYEQLALIASVTATLWFSQLFVG